MEIRISIKVIIYILIIVNSISIIKSIISDDEKLLLRYAINVILMYLELMV